MEYNNCMADKIDVSHIKFISTAFPTAADMKLWHSLSDAEKHAVIMRDIDEGLHGPVAKNANKEDLIAAVMADYAHAG